MQKMCQLMQDFGTMTTGSVFHLDELHLVVGSTQCCVASTEISVTNNKNAGDGNCLLKDCLEWP